MHNYCFHLDVRRNRNSSSLMQYIGVHLVVFVGGVRWGGVGWGGVTGFIRPLQNETEIDAR